MRVKYISILFLVLFVAANKMAAQEYKISANNTVEGKLILQDFMDELLIEGYDGNAIIFLQNSTEEDKENSVQDGVKKLEKIYKGETGNSKTGLDVGRNGNQITVTCLLPNSKRRGYKVKVPNNMSIKVLNDSKQSNDISISNMKNEVAIDIYQSIKLSNNTGSLVLSTINGDIDIENCYLDEGTTVSITSINGNINAGLSQIKTKEPISISSISGDLSLTLPANVTANLKLISISGNIYSDFNFSDESKKINQVVGIKLENLLNGGGVDFNLSTVTGNIHLKKGI